MVIRFVLASLQAAFALVLSLVVLGAVIVRNLALLAAATGNLAGRAALGLQGRVRALRRQAHRAMLSM